MHVLAVGDPSAAKLNPHPAAQRLGEQQLLRKRIRDQEPADRRRGKRSLLPGKTDGFSSFQLRPAR
jgi:hypothetical protein